MLFGDRQRERQLELLLSPQGAALSGLIAIASVAFASGFHGPRWLAFISGAGLLAILAFLTTLAVRNLKWVYRPARCPRCDYNRAGLERGDKCPECGHSPRNILDSVKSRWW